MHPAASVAVTHTADTANMIRYAGVALLAVFALIPFFAFRNRRRVPAMVPNPQPRGSSPLYFSAKNMDFSPPHDRD